MANLARRVAEVLGAGPHADFNVFLDACETDADKHGVNITAPARSFCRTNLWRCRRGRCAGAPKSLQAGKSRARPHHGLFEAEIDGKPA
jgi:type I restriction enzyme M protein